MIEPVKLYSNKLIGLIAILFLYASKCTCTPLKHSTSLVFPAYPILDLL